MGSFLRQDDKLVWENSFRIGLTTTHACCFEKGEQAKQITLYWLIATSVERFTKELLLFVIRLQIKSIIQTQINLSLIL